MPRTCPPDKILNPATNICVKRTGTIGRRLTGYCPPSKIRNPTSGRCVNRDGPMGRKILRAQGVHPQPAPRPPRSPRSTLTKPQLLALVKDLCFNDDVEPIALDEWDSMSVAQLRTIVRLLDNGGVDFFKRRSSATASQGQQRAHCFLLQNIQAYLQEWRRRYATRRPPVHPTTRVPLTPTQVDLLLSLRR